LVRAAETDDVDAIRNSLAAGALVDHLDDAGKTPLHVASYAGNVDAAAALLDGGAYIDSLDDAGRSPLFHAVMGNCVGVVKLLVARKADVAVNDRSGRSALHWAAYCGREKVVGALLDAGADGILDAPDSAGRTALVLAVQHSGDCGRGIAVVEEGDDTQTSDVKETIVRLLHGGANINATDRTGATALHWAARKPRTALIPLLLSRGANVDAKDKEGHTPLDIARLAGNRVPLEMLSDPIRTAENVKEREEPELSAKILEAAGNGNLEEVRKLLGRGADPNATREDGTTPLHLAASAGKRRVVVYLLLSGARADARDKEGRSARDLAQANGHERIVELIDKHLKKHR